MVEDDARGSGIGHQPWPARADDLLRTDLCPACFAPLGALVCSRCGLDVRAPDAVAVLTASRRVVDAVAERERLVEAMRRWSDAAARARRDAAAAAVADQASAGPIVDASVPVTAAASVHPATTGSPVPAAPATTSAGTAPAGETALPRLRTPRMMADAAPPAPRRRISVPAVLLAVGVVLLSVAAVFYVVYAFVTYGLVVRAAITAAVTLAALAASGVLARRRLPGTAEAVGVVGIVLLHLDVWAVRSYDLAGAASNDPFVHFGVGTLVVSAALLALRPLLRIRAAGIAGWAGLPVGVGLLVGAVPSADAGTRTALALAAASAVALVHEAPRSRAAGLPDALERALLRVVGVVAAAAAVVAGAASAVDPDAVPAVPLLVAAAASGVHAWALARAASPAGRRLDERDRDAVASTGPDEARPASDGRTTHAGPVGEARPSVPLTADDGTPSGDPLRVLAAAVAGVGAAAALPITALMGGPALLTVGAQLAAAALVAAVLDVASRRLRDPVVSATARVAALSSLVIAVLAGLPAAIAGLGGITAVLAVGLPAWGLAPSADAVVVLSRASGVAGLPGDVRAAASGLVAVWILAVAAALAGGRLPARRALLGWAGAAVVVAAIPALGPVAVVTGAYLAASAGALAWRLAARSATSLERRRAVPPGAPFLALSLAAGGLAWAASWASTGTWWVVTPIVVLLLVVGSRTARLDDTARLATAGAALVGLIAAGALAPSLVHAGAIGQTPRSSVLDAAADPLVLVLLGSALAVLVAGALPGAPGVRRRALLATVLLPACLSALVAAVVGADRVGGSLTASPAWSIAAQVVLVAGLVLWSVGGVRRAPLPPRAPQADSEAAAPRTPGTTALRRWRLATAGLVAPSMLLAVLTAGALVGRRVAPHGVVAAAVALLVAGAALLAYRRASRALRIALDAGTAVVASGALLAAVSSDATREGHELLWIPLLVLAATASVLAIAHDGLLVSRSARRAWGWTALGTAIAALWSSLLARGVTMSEAYWLPVAGALLLLAALLHRAAVRADRGGADAPGGPRVRRGVVALTLAGILTAVLPLAVVGRADDVLRPSLLTGICAVLAIAAAAALRRAPSPVRPLPRAVVVGAGIGLLVVGGAHALRLAGLVDRDPAVDLQTAATAAVLVVVGALALRGARDLADARVAGSAWMSASALVGVVMLASVDPGEGAVRPLVASVALVAGAGVLVRRSVHRRVLAGSAAVAMLGAVVVALLAWRGGSTSSDPAALAVPAIVAVLVAAVGAADRLRVPAVSAAPEAASAAPGSLPTRTADQIFRVVPHAADLATGALVVGTVAVAASVDGAGLPVALLLSGVAVLVASSGPGSRARRHVGWAALVLGSAALWMALARGRVDAVEAYVLPPAGIMLILAALLQRGLPRRLRGGSTADNPRSSRAAPVLLGALLLAALPTAFASWTGTPVRALVLGSAAGVVLLGTAAALRRADPAPHASTRPLLLVTAAASGLTVPLVGFGRTVAQLAAREPATFGRADLWTLTAAAVLVVAVALLPAHEAALARSSGESRLGWGAPASDPAAEAADTGPAQDAARPPRLPTASLLPMAPRIAVLVALVGAGAVGTVGLLRAHAEGSDGVAARSALLVGLVAVLHVACAPSAVAPSAVAPSTVAPDDAEPRPAGPAVDAAPLRDRVLALAALALGGLVAVVLALTGTADPVETVTVPIAAALLAVGARHLLRDATAGSMRHLGPGLLVLLVPPLLADLGPSPAWRIVGLGVLALATLLVGARLRLRAPFLLGAVVLLAHALAQLWPWIREASATVPWWAWAGIGGVVLIAVAARYERRIRDVKEAAARVSALR
ncbi:SCO7613 C-terminal domain-containing membrane protein [Clavibacter tessellarius]|uniref:SCO7613 C-terminal domain-containing membrane protein n=1 Tax=Clavibacter tessellarius TaxID=31965 RepID=UPI0039EA5AD3